MPPMNKLDSVLLAEVDAEHEKWADCFKAWDTMHEAEEKVFFHTLEIAKDGGLEEIGTKEELWYKTRPISATVLILFIVYNFYFLVSTDIALLDTSSGPTANDTKFLLSKHIFELCFATISIQHATAWLAASELTMLGVVICVTCYQGFLAATKEGLQKWWALSFICWECLPQLSSFSAMKLLAYISPSKISVDLFDILFYRESGVAKALIIFIVTRPLFVVFGIDCFLIKFRLASAFVMAEEFQFVNFLGSFVFLNQILGALNLSRELRFRLYRYVFGGEDGIITDEEKNIQVVWEAMVTEKVFGSYPRWKALSIMLTWCDDDFQLLTLNQVNFKIGE